MFHPGGKLHQYLSDLKDTKLLFLVFEVRPFTYNLYKAYRPNAHLLYIVMHYNGNIL